jgi:N utilization substance protein B
VSTSPEPDRPRPAGRRRQARERALALLYEAETRSVAPTDVLADLVVPPDGFAAVLVEGVAANASEIDRVVSAHADGWTIDRMPVLDRTVLRMATFELLHLPDVPVAVVIDEAVELAKAYSTEDSGRYVNGVLAAVAADFRKGA